MYVELAYRTLRLKKRKFKLIKARERRNLVNMLLFMVLSLNYIKILHISEVKSVEKLSNAQNWSSECTKRTLQKLIFINYKD